MPRIDDAYSILWRYFQSSLFTAKILIYETRDDHDDHGIQTRIVSRVLLRVGQSILLNSFSTQLTIINVQPTSVNPTSDPTNLFLPM